MKIINNSKINFSTLRSVSEYIQKNNNSCFVSYLNDFSKGNIFDKFRDILISWNNDVSYVLTFNLNGTPAKIQLSYILSELNNITSPIYIEDGNVKITLGIPDQYYHNEDLIPIYGILKHINISGFTIDMEKLSIEERKNIIDNLPAKIYNTILNYILQDKSKTIVFDNPTLKDVRLNFLTNEPYLFLRGLFSNYDEYYFRDIVFHLSKRIDGQLLLDSTPLDIEYYLEKYTEETKAQNNNMSI